MGRNRALGVATVTILKALREGHRFGLDMMQATDLPSGTVYPTLARLEARGLVLGTWEEESDAKEAGRPRRRYYEITPAGSLALEEALARLGVLAGPADRQPSPGPA